MGSLKSRYKRRKIFNVHENTGTKTSEKRVNQILDKILEEGIENLTPEERRIMNDYTDN